jgi:DNA modification methylase
MPKTSSQATRSDSCLALQSANALYQDLQLAIEQVPVEELTPYTRKLKKHSKAHIEQLSASIKAFGLVQPLVIDATGEIIAGHGLLAAARQAGYAHVPVVRLQHLDEPQKRTLRIALNRLAELSGWDEGLLALEFKDLLSFDLSLDLSFDLAITGFAQPQIDQLIEQAAAEGAPDQDDVIPEVNDAPPVSHLGDLWHLGPHRLLCADATQSETYTTLLGDEQAAMGIHDAPYNVAINGHVSGSGRHTEFVMASGEMTSSEFSTFLTSCLTGTTAALRPGAIQFVFMDWRHMGEVLTASRACALELKNLCVWNKGSGAMGSFYRSQHELVFVLKQPGGAHINNVQLGKFGRNRTNVWDHPGATSLRDELKLHATPKPVALIAEAIRDCSHRGEIVLDAFSGSGTTLIAAAKTGRRAYVVELDPKFVDVAIQRWEQWSGETARHAVTGLTFAETTAARLQEQSQAASLSASVSDLPSPVRVRQRFRAA